MTIVKYKRFISQCDITLVESNDLNKNKILGELKERIKGHIAAHIARLDAEKSLVALSKAKAFQQLEVLRTEFIKAGDAIEEKYQIQLNQKYDHKSMVIGKLLTIKFNVISESFLSDELLVDFPTFISSLDEGFDDDSEEIYDNLENYLLLYLKNHDYLKNDLTEIGNDLNSYESIYICANDDFSDKYGFYNISYIEGEYIEVLIEELNEHFSEQYPSSFKLKDKILELLATRLRCVETGYEKIRFNSIYDVDLPFIVKLDTTDLLVFIDNELKKSVFEQKLKKIGVDQKEFCSLTGVTQQTVSRWKREASYPQWIDFALTGLGQYQLNKKVHFTDGLVTKVATFGQFQDFEYVFAGYDADQPSIIQFRCKQDSDFDVIAFRGDDDELPWVSFKNDFVGVLLDLDVYDEQYSLYEDNRLLNIDITPEVFADSLELFKY